MLGLVAGRGSLDWWLVRGSIVETGWGTGAGILRVGLVKGSVVRTVRVGCSVAGGGEEYGGDWQEGHGVTGNLAETGTRVVVLVCSMAGSNRKFGVLLVLGNVMRTGRGDGVLVLLVEGSATKIGWGDGALGKQ